MIYIEILGGLGNQLFQIFTGISYSVNYRVPFKIKYNKEDIVSPLDGTSKRPTYWDTFLNSISNFTYIQRPFLPVFKERQLFKYNIIPDIGEEFILFGYFQSYLYFENNKDTIIRLLKIDKNKALVKNEFSEIFRHKKPISMHFRIGDYAKASHVHPILNIEYYKNALKTLCEKIPNLSRDYYVLYFFEEQDTTIVNTIVTELIMEYSEIDFRPCDISVDDWKQMLLMSNCSHNILANSTFSWWGAYLNDNVNKIVIYPEKWTGLTNETEDLFPNKWIMVNI